MSIGNLPYPKVLTPDQIWRMVNRLYDTLVWISPLLNDKLGQVEPPASKRLDGLLAYADGTTWNPGSGKGLYRYNSATSAWVFVG